MAKDKSETATTIKKSRVRSPNFPVVTLTEAVALLEKLHAKFGTHPVPIMLVHELWGYTKGSNTGNQCVSALNAFGLVDVVGKTDDRRVCVSKIGVRVAGKAPDRDQLLSAAATSPKVYREILEHYGDRGLPDDALLRQYLVWDRPEGQRFNPDSVDDFIADFRDTLTYANGTCVSIIDPPAKAEVELGSMVQWTSNGADQFPAPREVVGFSDDREWAFLAGESTGVLVSELAVVDPPAARVTTPPTNPFKSAPEKIPAGMTKLDTLLDEGPVSITWPDTLSAESYAEFVYWLDGIKHRAARKAGIKADKKKPE